NGGVDVNASRCETNDAEGPDGNAVNLDVQTRCPGEISSEGDERVLDGRRGGGEVGLVQRPALRPAVDRDLIGGDRGQVAQKADLLGAPGSADAKGDRVQRVVAAVAVQDGLAERTVAAVVGVGNDPGEAGVTRPTDAWTGAGLDVNVGAK